MKFKAEFRNEEGKRIVETPPGEVGLDMVDIIREELGMDVCLGKIDKNIGCFIDSMYTTQHLPEDMARKVPVFKGKNFVRVYIPENYFSKYYVAKFIPERKCGEYELSWWKMFLNKFRSEENRFEPKYVEGEICNVKTEFRWDTEQILSDWVEAGCPEYWDCDKYEPPEEEEPKEEPPKEFKIIHNNKKVILAILKICYQNNLSYKFTCRRGEFEMEFESENILNQIVEDMQNQMFTDIEKFAFNGNDDKREGK